MKTVTISPAYNEQAVLAPIFYKRLTALANNNKKYNFEFLFTNDGSTDNTLSIYQNYANRHSHFYVNHHEILAKNQPCSPASLIDDATVIIDADLQDPPELIPKMISYWEDGYDDVYAKRTVAKVSRVQKKAQYFL